MMANQVALENCLATKRPDLAEEWNQGKNGSLTPYDVTCNSNKKVWWQCSKGHEWEATANKRSIGRKCPYCTGKRVSAENSLATTHPHLIDSWLGDKNYPLTPNDFSKGSDKKAWWKCEKGHEWDSTISSRANGRGCPYCSGKKVNKENSLETNSPDVSGSWNYEKNHPLKPSDVAPKSNKKFWWVCDKGHEWEAPVYVRTSGCGCPYCANKIVTEENSLASNHPEIARSWNYDKNLSLTPSDVTSGSNRRVWWKCEKGHEWDATVVERTSRGDNCPYCSNRRVWEGNCLAVTHPEMVSEWNHERNQPLTPFDVTFSSSKKVWWKCGKGHEWEATLNNRSSGTGCPYCSNQKVNEENSIATTHPHITKMWHTEKNGSLTPADVTSGTRKLVWWKCEKGHEYRQRVYYKVISNGCPICQSGKKTSFAEKCLYYYLNKQFPDTVGGYKFDGKREIDVFIPSLNLGIEYDGERFHETEKGQQRDLIKNQDLESLGYTLIRVKEQPKTQNDDNKRMDSRTVVHAFQSHNSQEYFQALDKCVALVLDMIQNEYGIKLSTLKIDSYADRINIKSLIEHGDNENSLGYCHPELLEEWNEEKNRELSPYSISRGAKIKVWWKCKRGHEWEASVCNRTNKDMHNDCPYCHKQSRIDSFAHSHPQLLEEWDYEKNEKTPFEVSKHSATKVWWKCNQGHEWQSYVHNRTKSDSGCPICELLQQWNYERNEGLNPLDTSISEKVWWKCRKGHEWQAFVKPKVENHNLTCPRCSVVSKNLPSLFETHPELEQEWDFEKNNDIVSPDEVSKSSRKKVWWKCKEGHEWENWIYNRTKKGSKYTKCPICRKQEKKDN